MGLSEADTRSKLIDPKLKDAGWDESKIQREYKVTDGRINFDGQEGVRGKAQYADYLLRYKPSIRIALVEAKKEKLSHLEGLNQVKEYARKLGLRFAYTTNGHEIEFIDIEKNIQESVQSFHSPEELWSMYQEGIQVKNSEWIKALLQDYYEETGIGINRRNPRYYQEKAVQKVIESVIEGEKRVLVNMATGTGKTFTSVQTIYKLWSSGTVKRILFIVDRNILADQAFKDFDAAFEKGACWRLRPDEKQFNKGRSIYFGIYQSLVGTEDDHGNSTGKREDRFKEFPPNFFDLIVIDECHRGGANEEGQWFRLLDYFKSSVQIGLTATPKRTESINTYSYFGEPVVTYSLKDGINDGYLAPYVIKRVRSELDTFGFQPEHYMIDVSGQEVKEKTFEMKDFERKLSFPERTRFYAKHLIRHLYKTDLLGKTIVFCVDQRHAADMAKYVNEAYKSLIKERGLPEIVDYALRITSNDKSINGRYLDLERFQDLEQQTPVVVTTSKLLTTGIDVKNIKNVVIFTQIGSMSEFKQVIGRGTRIYDTNNELTQKLGFTILEYGNTSTSLFYDPEFDGEPEFVDDEDETDNENGSNGNNDGDEGFGTNGEDEEEVVKRVRYRLSDDFMRDQVKVSMEVLNLLGDDGETLSPSEFIQYQSGKIRTMYADANVFYQAWENPKSRKSILEKIKAMNIKVNTLAELFCIEHDRKDIDLFDIIMHLAFGFQLVSKSERIKEFKKHHRDFLKNYREQAREVLETIFEIYEDEEYQPLQIKPEVFRTSKFQELNIRTINDVQEVFGSKEEMLTAFKYVQSHFYEGKYTV
ncbi:type I site-specific deoxyribonuclease [Priestia aryabhattai]|uniref:EcoAI/FtnUII family type I restriction enzme subunit R n=1 Tax=Priestia aryabhattai TaxID=412384 RepID=UPI000B51370D|nr:DEAD/DEAH box helicase family protein [Priestia aryabhattai]OVE34161.1 type I site-specific deoxyribonuclease [Priestia aryabhattai]